ncbi:SDR family NAD(P)-dependent oxidoreductase [Prosthecochloris sp. HL-130-GSB]|uniref:SDR family NAD(P)-dependent oxidoreductase n=1 Tax=Prosthecochloris sp. HL-130-GSB TaxID=1974213 RepID=UPI0018DE2BE5|nr:SDR family NAD(P)-dependent oxidoreductase [Prosthecochloris sp. HL-130-GSB]
MGSVLITGATSGIGEAFARQYAAKNSHLLLVARSQEMLRSLAEELAGSWNIRVDIFPSTFPIPAVQNTLLLSAEKNNSS